MLDPQATLRQTDRMQRPYLLTVNSGSSSVRCGLFVAEDAAAAAIRQDDPNLPTGELPEPIYKVHVELPSTRRAPRLHVTAGPAKYSGTPRLQVVDHASALAEVFAWLAERDMRTGIGAVGHRVVHGGTRAAPMPITPALLRALEELAPLAPLHQPNDLAAIEAVRAQLPGARQVACFDTMFHRTLPPRAHRLAVPSTIAGMPLRRFGFHGLAYEAIAGEMLRLAPTERRIVAAHLGNGASLCAIDTGVSVDTTMGVTPLDGLPMGTRSGTLDPGLVLWLQREGGHPPERLAEILWRESGLLGLSGTSADMRMLLETRTGQAREAVEVFCYRAAQGIAAMAVAMGGVDAIVFSGGMGKRAGPVRAGIAEHLEVLGVRYDPVANGKHRELFSRPDSRVKLRIVNADEEGIIARHTARTLGLRPAQA